jgi:DNA-binding transcriptional regulator PaaX
MTRATDRIDRQIRTHLRRPRQIEWPPTVGDIYDDLSIPTSSIRAAIRRLLAAGEIEQSGVSNRNAATWRLTTQDQP